jgi:hypothetical protein
LFTRKEERQAENEGWYNTSDYIGICHYWNLQDGKNTRADGLSVSLTNIAQAYITAFVQALQEIQFQKHEITVKGDKDGEYKIENEKTTGDRTVAGSNLFDLDSTDTLFKTATTVGLNSDQALYSGFYDALFNRICVSGWTENENIESVEYMQELMKSGAVYISSINNDGNYYQSGYSTDTYIAEVADLEGVAQAEAKYNAAKAKIENKENTIDMKMKNLDTEISSLTTEYDAVKGIISKTVEKSFKRYDA